MTEYLNKDLFLQSMGLVGDETKYGNRDGKHQSRSYGTWMGYEIIDSVEDSVVEEDVVEVVRCKDCENYSPFSSTGLSNGHCSLHHTDINENDFCSYGERREGE